MDTQESANLATIENTRLTRRLVVIGIATLIFGAFAAAFAAWPILFPPDPSSVPPTGQGGAVMVRGWIPVILLGSCSLVIAAALLIVTFRQRTRKSLVAELAKRAEENKTLVGENATLGNDLRAANGRIEVLEGQQGELNTTITGVRAENQRLESVLRDANDEIQRRESNLVQLQHDIAEATKRANDEKNSKDEIYRQFQIKERYIAQWSWLWNIAQDQAKDISEHVTLTKIDCCKVKLADIRCVTVTLQIKNTSLYDITIKPNTVTGHLSFNGKSFRDPVRDITETRSRVMGLKPQKQGLLTIEQPLLETESETIKYRLKDPTAEFEFNGLSIPLSIDNIRGVAPTNLRIHADVETVLLSNFVVNEGL